MKRFTLTARLVLLLLLPLSGVAAFGMLGAWTKWKAVQTYGRLQSSTAVVGEIGNLVHELQKERGRSAVFAGSKGSKFAAELSEQQQFADAELRKLSDLLPHFDIIGFGSEFESNWKKAFAAVNELQSKRAALRSFSLTANDSTAYFTQTIASLLDVIVAISHRVNDVEIANGVACYVNFLQAKEQMGIERAVLCGVFSANKFSDDTLSQFSKATAAQDTYLGVFGGFATPAQKSLLAHTVQGRPVEDVAAMRQTASDKAMTGEFGVPPAAWFDAITAKIDLMKQVEDTLRADYHADARRIQSEAQTSFVVYSLVTVLILVLTAICGAWIVRSVSKSLKLVASGLSAGAEQTVTAANQVSASSQSLAEGASEQAASLEETSSSLEEMSSMTKRNAEHSRKASDLAKQARDTAEKGATDMQIMSAAMGAIKKSSDDTAAIIKSIDGIAFQTNILALNAAVEAARAGEAGMGFAVVAEEVRNLAQKSAEAAKSTSANIQEATNKIAQGVDISQRVGQALNEIVTQARQLDQLVAEVASASSEQTNGIAHINTAVSQMDKVTQSNASNAEESAAAAEELNAQARGMKECVIELLQLVNGGSEPAAPDMDAAVVPAGEVPAYEAKRPIRESKLANRCVSLGGHTARNGKSTVAYEPN